MATNRIYTLLVASLICFASAGATKSQRRPTPLDLRTPLTNIGSKLDPVIQNLNISMLIEVGLELLMNCTDLSIPFPTLLTGNQNLEAAFSQFHHEIKMRKIDFASIEPLISADDITEYCNTEDFEIIHNHTWVEDEQANDLVKFLWRFGWPDAYEILKGVYLTYKCPQKLINTLPKAPVASETPARLKRSAYDSERAYIREQFLQSRGTGTPAQEKECNLLPILLKLEQAGALDLLLLVRVLADEFATNPSIHFMLGKIQEPVKKDSVRAFRMLPPVRHLFYLAHEAIVSEPTVRAILELIKDITGIDLIASNIIEAVVGIVELILWQNAVPVPPYEPPPTTATEAPTTQAENLIQYL